MQRGLWRLRLPLDIPGVPHCNAWAIDTRDGIVLVDTGVHQKGSMHDLERALEQAGRVVEDVRLVVITHAHADHCGQAVPIAERARCEVWIHPAYRQHVTREPDRALAIGRLSGVPEEPLQRWAERRDERESGVVGDLRSDRDLVAGVTVASALGGWHVVETPGHAPSHVVLHQPERRLLISGDHLLGRVSQYFDVGYTPDPVGEFLHSLDVADALDVRLVLAGHARPFTDMHGHVAANRALVARQLDAVRGVLAGGPRTAYDVARAVYAEVWNEAFGHWLLSQTLAWLIHLEALGEARRKSGEPAEAWSLSS